MTPIVVADTSPLRYLAEIGLIRLLPELFGRVFIPAIVYAELQRPATPTRVASAFHPIPEWLCLIDQVSDHAVAPNMMRLDVGERHAILLALSISASLVLIDERKGASVAQASGLDITGTLGILVLAANRQLVDLEAAFDLRKTSFHCPERIMKALLNDAKASE